MYQGKLAAAKWLFEHGAAADVRALNHDGFTPMHKACRGDHLEVGVCCCSEAKLA